MTVKEAVEYINAHGWSQKKAGLERTTELLERLGNPHKELRFVHVAGSNGKGSTCAMLERILREAGYRTGFFPSPYIEDFRERIQVSGECISEEALCEITGLVRAEADDMEDHPSQFELITEVSELRDLGMDISGIVREMGIHEFRVKKAMKAAATMPIIMVIIGGYILVMSLISTKITQTRKSHRVITSMIGAIGGIVLIILAMITAGAMIVLGMVLIGITFTFIATMLGLMALLSMAGAFLKKGAISLLLIDAAILGMVATLALMALLAETIDLKQVTLTMLVMITTLGAMALMIYGLSSVNTTAARLSCPMSIAENFLFFVLLPLAQMTCIQFTNFPHIFFFQSRKFFSFSFKNIKQTILL